MRPLEIEGALGVEQVKRLSMLIEERRKNGKLLQAALANHPNIIIQKETGESGWFGFSLVIRPGSKLTRKALVAKLKELGFECRPIVAGNFAKNEVVKYFDSEVHGTLKNAEHIDQNGLFVGNHQYRCPMPDARCPMPLPRLPTLLNRTTQMNLPSRIRKKLILLYRRHVQRDPFLLEIARWLKDKGDETLRLDYPLTPDSIVFDLGGYQGDFAAAVNARYGCKVYVLEPVPEFHQKCVERFQDNPKIICFNYGLSSAEGWLDIGLAENASSFASPHAQGAMQQVRVRSIVECIRELGLDRIDLMKINIEGGEFDVLPAIIQSDDIEKVQHLQIQFHDFVDHAAERREAIRAQLASTHAEMWNYVFVWESWKRKEASR